MNCCPAPTNATIHLPKLAAMMLVFLGLSPTAHMDTATVRVVRTAQPQLYVVQQPKSSLVPVSNDDGQQIHVLSPRDAALYRVAFAAQEKAEWKIADEALAQIKDKKLTGHVLADRYMRRGITLEETQSWLALYSDLPEAPALYEQAQHLRSFAAAHIPAPHPVTPWSGGNGLNSSSGFRASSENDNAIQKSHISAKINAALHHGTPIEARELLTTELQRGTLTASDAQDTVSRIAAAFYYQGEIERARTMARTAAAAGVPLGLWIDGLSAWKQKDYSGSMVSFAALADAPGLSSWDRAAAAYWAYRASMRTGDKTRADHWLAEAAKAPRSFYGHMAASQIGTRMARSWKMPELTNRNIAILSQLPSGWQALALVQVGKNDMAESELRRLNPTASHDLQNATLALAEKAHMPSLTLQLSGATNDNGQLYEAALYPLPPWQPSSGFKVDRALIYALMRHESQFDPEAVSERGACGLMQIMPSTARQIANDNVPGRDCPDRLFDPATNMDMGQQYVRVLAGQPMIGNNLMLLLAAYNGGPGNLAHWLDGGERTDPLLFVESLPVRETRDYVQQVLLHYWMYRARLSEPETSVAQLAHGEWPRYALRDEAVQRASAQSMLEMASLDPASVGAGR